MTNRELIEAFIDHELSIVDLTDEVTEGEDMQIIHSLAEQMEVFQDKNQYSQYAQKLIEKWKREDDAS